MKPIALGAAHSRDFDTMPAQSAHAVGNTGVDVVSSVTLIGFIEIACYEIIRPGFEGSEASVGIGFNFTHLAPAPIGARITVKARLIAIDGRKFEFETEVLDGGRLLMTGTHRRAIIDLERFRADEAGRDKDR